MTGGNQNMRLIGYEFSVYTRIVKIALSAKGLSYDYLEADPFMPEGQAQLSGRHPFSRVPVLEYAGFEIWETAAILDYLDLAFSDPPLIPQGPLARARMRQVIGIVDNYGYWPLVRQVFSHGYFQPLLGEAADREEVETGLRASEPVLAALEAIAVEGHVLGQGAMSLADCHLIPMLEYFVQAPEGQTLIEHYPALAARLELMRAMRPFLETWPDLQALKQEVPE